MHLDKFDIKQIISIIIVINIITIITNFVIIINTVIVVVIIIIIIQEMLTHRHISVSMNPSARKTWSESPSMSH